MFVQGQGQKSEQKHRTKNFAKLPNHLPLLTMVSSHLKSAINNNLLLKISWPPPAVAYSCEFNLYCKGTSEY